MKRQIRRWVDIVLGNKDIRLGLDETQVRVRVRVSLELGLEIG